MQRIAKLLMIAGLVLMLCAPAVALAQNDWPLKGVPCGPTPVIDGQWDPAWEMAHWEDITLEQNLGASQDEYPPYGADLLVMHDGDRLNIFAATYWDLDSLDALQEEPVLGQVFCLAFEDDAPAWEWNADEPWMGSDEGWLCFFGIAPYPHALDEVAADESFLIEGESLALYLGRTGYYDDSNSEDCFGEYAVDFEGAPVGMLRHLEGVKHAFAAEHPGVMPMPLQNDEEPPWFVWITEVGIDLRNSPLNLRPGESYRGWFGIFGVDPTLPIPILAGGELTHSDIMALAADVIARQEDHDLFGFWPGGRPWGPEQYAFFECCFAGNATAPINDGTCNWCLPCHGLVDLGICEVEFVPEPSTLLLLSGGLMGLAGYAGLRLRKR